MSDNLRQYRAIRAQISVGGGLPATAREPLTTGYASLARHREHIDYAVYKALGLPLGSGRVESACKWLIQQRFKGV
jgi:hypothetical protein